MDPITLDMLGQGQADGQIRMVRNGNNVGVYQWSAATATWLDISNVINSPGSDRRRIYDGRTYDFVFDVDLQDGMPPLKLPYDTAENPRDAARRFIKKNTLPETYLDVVVQFIAKNTRNALGANTVNSGPDTVKYVAATATALRAGTVLNESTDRRENEADFKANDNVARDALPTCRQETGGLKEKSPLLPEPPAQESERAGQNVIKASSDDVEVFTWASAIAKAGIIGGVADAGAPLPRIYNGRDYDFLFEIVFEDIASPLKLPFNLAENPYIAARQFLEKHNLSMTSLEKMVQMIEATTGRVHLGPNAPELLATSNSARTYCFSYKMIPPERGSKPLWPDNKKLPITEMLSFKQANLVAMRSKIIEFNDSIAANPATASQALAPEEVVAIDSIFFVLSHAVRRPSDQMTWLQVGKIHVELLMSILERWDDSRRFPVLDLLRLICIYSPISYAGIGVAVRMFRAIVTAADLTADWAVPMSKTREMNTLLALRALANATHWSKAEYSTPVLVELVKVRYAALGKNHRVALATIIFNISARKCENEARIVQPQALEVLNMILQNEDSESEAAYRAFVSLGNFAVVAAKEGSLSTLKDALVAGMMLSSKFKEPRFSIIAAELRVLPW